MWGEGRGALRDAVTQVPQRLPDDLPLVPVTGSDEVSDVLQKHDLWAALLDDPGDVPEQRPPGLIHATLRPRLGEGLAWESGGQDFVLGDSDRCLRGVLRDVTQRVDAPVPLVDRRRGGVDLDGIDTLAAHLGQSSVEPADPGE